MKALGYYQNLPIEDDKSIELLEVDKPILGKRDVLVKVEAVGLNTADIMARGVMPILNPPMIPGWDVSGTVVEIGEEVSLFSIGDEVYYAGDMMLAGGNAEYAKVDERIVGLKPKSLTFAQAAGFPLTTLTAYEAMFDRIKISMNKEDNKGKTILIINAAGGVGSIAIQLAKMVGLTVIGTAVEEENVTWAKEMGVDYTISHFKPFLTQIKELGLGMVDYALNFHSSVKNWEPMLEAVKPQGDVALIALGEPVSFGAMGTKSISVHWELMFTRSANQTEDMQRQHDILNHVATLIDDGTLKSIVSKTYSPISAQNMRKAHAQIETGHTYGKVVLTGGFE